MHVLRLLSGGLLLAVLVTGCGPRIKEELINVPESDPMDRVKATLQNYAKGQPLTSEVSGFDAMVEEVRKVHPTKADAVKKGLDEIKAVKGSPKAKATELLKKLGLDGPEKK